MRRLSSGIDECPMVIFNCVFNELFFKRDYEQKNITAYFVPMLKRLAIAAYGKLIRSTRDGIAAHLISFRF